ncbi:MAG: HD domain-containing protein [Phascolarctobacterium sp.]|nr:HD domain-containing protein [Phascolarctobacterium sp.]
MMIKDFKAGGKICQALLVRVQKIGASSNGGVFARGLLEDNSGKIPFICFKEVGVDRLREAEGPMPFMIAGSVDVGKFQSEINNLQVVVQRVSNLMPEDDVSNLLPRGNFDIEEYKVRLANLIKSVRVPSIRTLLENIFSGDFYEKFAANPAGMRMHHAYIGGLLQHTVDVTSLALAMAVQIGDVDKDLVIAGGLLHDIGKVREMSSQVGFPYTDDGRFLGHITITVMMVRDAAAKLGIPEVKMQRLEHILISHHGDTDKGSPIACSTKEAFIVHYADELNAIMNQFATHEGKNPWEYNRMTSRFLHHEKP